MFHVPWCDHCLKFMSSYEKLAEKLKNVETLILGKFDATVNEV